MKLGYSVTSFHPPDVPPARAAETLIDRAQTALDAGYDYVEAGDHHVVRDGNYLQNVPTAARLSGSFDHVAAMFLLPLYHPVLVAEQVGTLAAFTDRFDFWCAIGRADEALDAFSVPAEERAGRFEEALALLGRLWREDGVTFDGEFYAVDDVSVNPKADPRICIGGSAEPAVRRAGRLGDAWVAGPTESNGDLDRKRAWFAEAGGGAVLVRRDALALPDGDRARALARERLEAGYRGWPADADWPLVGDADDVEAELGRLRDLGADEVIVRPMDGAYAAETLGEVRRGLDQL